jgi:phage shock protein PspC (stress-responsive transcriptional regulator)
MVSGVSGGLGEYFRADPVIFRVLFAVLTFFAGSGLLLYLACWLLIPEPDTEVSALDRGVAHLRAHRIPPWLAIVGGALVLWIGWFSWWAPGPTFPALALIAVLLLVLVNRMNRPWSPPGPAHAPYPWETIPPTAPGPPTAAPGAPSGASAEPLVRPLNDPGRSMREWYTEAQQARRERQRRRRPIKVATGLALLAGWAVVGLVDAFHRAAFPTYLWVGISVLLAGLLTGLATRRVVPSLVVALLPLLIVALLFGGTRASLADGSGRLGLAPTSTAQLSDQKQFAGDTTLDLSGLPALTAPRTITITQAAGRVRIIAPSSLDVVVDADVHVGDIQRNASQAVGDFVAGVNISLLMDPQPAVTGPPLTVKVRLTVGHVQFDVGS